MADSELEAIRAEIARRESQRLSAAPTAPVTAAFTPGEQMAEDPELAVIRAEIARREGQQPAPAAPAPAGPQEQIQLSGEAADAAEARMEQYRQLPDLWSAPAASPIRSMANFTAFATNSGADDVENILRKNIPGTTVESDNGFKIYTFPGDPQKYAWKPGMQPSDIARAVPGMVGSGLAVAAAPSVATAVPAAIVANVVQSLLGESAKSLAGADPSLTNVAVSAALPPAMAFAKGGLKAAGGLISRATAPVGQKVDTVAEPFVERVKNLLTGWGAEPDASALQQTVSGMTEPAVNAARTAASQAAADAETATIGATAKAEADTVAAQMAAKDAKGAARMTAQDAALGVKETTQDALAAAAAKAEAEKAAASAPVDAVVDGAVQTLARLGAGEPSALSTKFIQHSLDLLDSMTKTAGKLFDDYKKAMPWETRIQPDEVFYELQDWLDKQLIGRNPSAFLKRIKKATEPREVGNAIQMPRAIDIIRAKRLASRVGHGGIEQFAEADKGEAKYVADLLSRVEAKAARDNGVGGVFKKANDKWAEKQAYRGEVKKVLTLNGEKSLRNATLVPKLDAAGKALVAQNLQPLKQIMNAAGPVGMKQEIMANIVSRFLDPSKGAESMVDAARALMKGEVNELVFGNLPPGARKKILGLVADAERALAQRADSIAAAEAAKKAETTALRRGQARDLAQIRNTKMAATRTAGETAQEAVAGIGKEKADTIAGAKAKELAAQEALRQAERVNVAMAPEIRKAGAAMLDGNIQPLEGLFKSAPGMEKEIAASTLYHTLVDPSKRGTDAFNHMADRLAKLQANTAMMNKVKSVLPNVTGDLDAMMQLAKEIRPATAAGGKKVEGALAWLAEQGPWAAGKTASAAAGVAAGMMGMGFGVGTSALTGVAAPLLGRILASRFAKDSTVETKAANAFLASDAGKALLRHLALEQPVTQKLLNRLGGDKVVKATARVLGMTPVRFLGKLVEHGTREAGEQGLSSNNTKKEE